MHLAVNLYRIFLVCVAVRASFSEYLRLLLGGVAKFVRLREHWIVVHLRREVQQFSRCLKVHICSLLGCHASTLREIVIGAGRANFVIRRGRLAPHLHGLWPDQRFRLLKRRVGLQRRACFTIRHSADPASLQLLHLLVLRQASHAALRPQHRRVEQTHCFCD